jgi:hypothetical protein
VLLLDMLTVTTPRTTIVVMVTQAVLTQDLAFGGLGREFASLERERVLADATGIFGRGDHGVSLSSPAL